MPYLQFWTCGFPASEAGRTPTNVGKPLYLVYLFAILDRSPKDGGVSLAELEPWLRRQAAVRLEAITRREMARHDRNGDGVV